MEIPEQFPYVPLVIKFDKALALDGNFFQSEIQQAEEKKTEKTKKTWFSPHKWGPRGKVAYRVIC